MKEQKGMGTFLFSVMLYFVGEILHLGLAEECFPPFSIPRQGFERVHRRTDLRF